MFCLFSGGRPSPPRKRTSPPQQLAQKRQLEQQQSRRQKPRIGQQHQRSPHQMEQQAWLAIGKP